ncbi:uncharacterized protein [Asterias amurensis]|uniref:uncharacterized protein n=1 Tax=Asterias amurensis TaxID=7602 RepID=UPI003AB46EA0
MAGSVSQHRVFCWSTPRSLSTAFMKCLSTIEGSVAWMEPYGTAEHFGPDGLLKPPDEVPPEVDYTHAWVKDKLEEDFQGRQAVIIKDLAYAVMGRLQYLPKGYRHSFLIRKPMKSFMSYYRLFKKMSGEEGDASLRGWLPQKGFSYGELAEMADYVEKDLGQQLVIIDADDILNHPATMLQKYCSALGLPFSESILSWEPGMPSNWIVPKSVREAEEEFHWMSTVLESRCFNKAHQTPSNEATEETPDIVKEMVAVAQPFYDKLYARRILPS